jgi:hypothetical protein
MTRYIYNSKHILRIEPAKIGQDTIHTNGLVQKNYLFATRRTPMVCSGPCVVPARPAQVAAAHYRAGYWNKKDNCVVLLQ